MKKYILLSVIIVFTNTILFSQEKKDTLFFKYDKNYLKKWDSSFPDFYFVKDTEHNGEYFFFNKLDIQENLHPKNILCLKKYIRRSKFYDEDNHIKLNDYRLYEHLRNFVIYLVKQKGNKVKYIKVEAMTMIE